jgi:hypothetical protein
MRQPFEWLKRLFAPGGDQPNVIQIFTPHAAAERGAGTRLALAGATFLAISVAGVVALSSLVFLLLAVGAIYFLVTEVLGIRLDVDPRVFVQRAQQYAASQNVRN